MDKKKILVIEDTPELQNMEVKALENAGFLVDVASDGADGLKKLKADKYDLVLMDIVMPNRTGFEVLNELKKVEIAIPIMVYSNMSELMSRNEAIKLGAVDYFEKVETPMEVVVEAITNFLNQTCTLRTKE